MSNLHMGEYIARERYNDAVRHAAAQRLVQEASARTPAARLDLRGMFSKFGGLLKARFRLPARAHAK